MSKTKTTPTPTLDLDSVAEEVIKSEDFYGDSGDETRAAILTEYDRTQSDYLALREQFRMIEARLHLLHGMARVANPRFGVKETYFQQGKGWVNRLWSRKNNYYSGGQPEFNGRVRLAIEEAKRAAGEALKGKRRPWATEAIKGGYAASKVVGFYDTQPFVELRALSASADDE